MRCTSDSKMYAVTLMLFLGKCGPCSKRYWVVQIEAIHHPVISLCAQSGIFYWWNYLFAIIIRRLHDLMQRRPTMLCTFLENGFLKKKTKTEAKFGPLSPTKYHWVTHTHRHTHRHEMLSDENGTNALCATKFIVYPWQCTWKIFEHAIA